MPVMRPTLFPTSSVNHGESPGPPETYRGIELAASPVTWLVLPVASMRPTASANASAYHTAALGPIVMPVGLMLPSGPRTRSCG